MDSAKDAEAARETQRSEQRAWLAATENIPPQIVKGRPAGFGVVIKNTGVTPAREVVADMGMIPLARATAFNPEKHVSYDTTSPPSKSVVMPGATIQMAVFGTKAPPLGPDAIGRLRSGEVVYYVHGRILYEDVFGRPHKTTYCVYMDQNLRNVHACPVYNYAD